MDQRRQFGVDARRYRGSFSELCTRYTISRQTGYKWVARADAEGLAALAEHARRPRGCPHAIAPELVAALCALRQRHPTWGPRKLVKVLRDRYPKRQWPARSTAADLLRRLGLVRPHRRRRRLGHPGKPHTAMTAPNRIWTADFKGQPPPASGSSGGFAPSSTNSITSGRTRRWRTPPRPPTTPPPRVPSRSA